MNKMDKKQRIAEENLRLIAINGSIIFTGEVFK